MDAENEKKLASLIRLGNIAALGTLRNEAPFVSMILFAAESNFLAFYIHASRLSFHTQDMLKDPRVSLMIVERDEPGKDPQQLARVSIQGEATVIARDHPSYAHTRQVYLAKHPSNSPLFDFSDFDLYRIVPKSARYVAGFARAFNLTSASLEKASKA